MTERPGRAGRPGLAGAGRPGHLEHPGTPLEPRRDVDHHLLDPRTGAPVPETLATGDLPGTTAVAANTASTAAIVLGPDAPAWLSCHDVAARLVGADGTVVRTGGWPADVEGAA